MHDIKNSLASGLVSILAVFAVACEPTIHSDEADAKRTNRIDFEIVGKVLDNSLSEISGIEAGAGPIYVTHNDDGPPDIWLLNLEGEIVARYRLENASNRDWEDLTYIPWNGRAVIAIGDFGDNERRRTSVQIYLVEMPEVAASAGGEEPRPLEVLHTVELSYPDGPRDCEAMAYDAASDTILLLTKRDRPPRLYGIDASEAMSADILELQFLGTVPTLRPPTRDDFRRLGKEADWISQPTGMDINADSSLAAVITYRSLYLFDRQPEESWIEAFNRKPREFLGPASRDEEAIAFSEDMSALIISTEGNPAPIYRVALPAPK